MKSHLYLLLAALLIGCQSTTTTPVSPRFNHVYLVVNDIDRSVAFYTTAFDLYTSKRIKEIRRKRPDGTVDRFDVNMALLKFKGQNFVLEIAAREDFEANNDSVSYAHLGIDVMDIEVAEKRLLDAGATLIRGIEEVMADDIVAKNSFYRGPDGETIELMQMMKGTF